MIQNLPHVARPKRVQSGLFEVYPDGQIFRFNAHGEPERCPWIINREYYAVSTVIKGQQHLYYVHRLLAEAFVPNPDNKPLVRFKNNDKTDLSVDNLYWDTYSELQENLFNQSDQKHRCTHCDEPTQSKNYTLCKPCRQYDAKIRRQNQKKDRIKNQLDRLDWTQLSKQTRRYVEMRYDGMTYQDIADHFGVTRQAVNYAITRAFKQQQDAYEALYFQH